MGSAARYIKRGLKGLIYTKSSLPGLYLTGKKSQVPSAYTLYKVAVFLSVSVDYLLPEKTHPA